MQRQVLELQNDADRSRADYDQLADKNKELTSANARLLEQLRVLEKASFEIEARVKRGLDAETENRAIDGQLAMVKGAEREAQR